MQIQASSLLDVSRVPIVDIEKLPPQSSSHKSSLISQEAIEYDSLRTDDACFGNEDQMSSTDSVTVETYDTSPIAVDLSTNSESFAGTPSADVKKRNHSIGNFPAAGAKGLSEDTEGVMPGQVLDGGTVEQANADRGNEQDVIIRSEDAELFGDSLEVTSLDFTKLEPSVGPKDVEVSMNEAELSLPVAQMDDFRGLGRVKGKQLFLDDVLLPSTRCRPKAGLPGNSVSPSVSVPLASPNAWKLAKDMRTPHRKGTHKAYVPSPFTPMDDFGTLTDDQLKAVIKSDDFTCRYLTSSIFSDATITTSLVSYLYSQGGVGPQVLSALSATIGSTKPAVEVTEEEKNENFETDAVLQNHFRGVNSGEITNKRNEWLFIFGIGDLDEVKQGLLGAERW
ncbi:uncharacterized protein [Watersipora subatra]|uniref:uncharacterized protein n=1 Tax=Watersipora subatra TaxID=2589382 RepID=UPI00355C98EC